MAVDRRHHVDESLPATSVPESPTAAPVAVIIDGAVAIERYRIAQREVVAVERGERHAVQVAPRVVRRRHRVSSRPHVPVDGQLIQRVLACHAERAELSPIPLTVVLGEQVDTKFVLRPVRRRQPVQMFVADPVVAGDRAEPRFELVPRTVEERRWLVEVLLNQRDVAAVG